MGYDHTGHLRDYQLEGYNKIRNFIGEKIKAGEPARPVMMAPCAWGKTQLAAGIASAALERRKRTLFVVDNLELVEQTLATFKSHGMHVGVMQGEHEETDYGSLVQVATAQTLAARLKKYRKKFESYPVGLIIHDECHVQYKAREMLDEIYPKTPTIGLSATPFSKGMGKFYNGLLQTATTSDLVERGFLTPLYVESHQAPDLTGVKISANGMYAAKPAGERYTPHLMGDIVKTWQAKCGHMSTIVFATDVAASRRLEQMFRSKGVNAVHIDGYGGSDADKLARQTIIEEFKAGKIQVLCNVGIAVKGFDAPIAECLVDCQPGKSLSRHIQKLGRIMRLFAGKKFGYVLDFAGNCILNGLPTDPLPTTLNKGVKGESSHDKRIVLKERQVCKGQHNGNPCGRLKELGERVCAKCGFEANRIAESIETEEGELVPFHQPDQPIPKQTISKREKDRWMRMFKHHEIMRQHKNGSSIYLYKEKFGEEPEIPFPQKTVPPDRSCLSYIKSRQIAYAKRQEKKKLEQAHA